MISVVIPVHNGAEILKSTLKSVVTQTHDAIEVLVVDDGSEEDIKSVVDAMKDGRLSYHRLPHTNANVARNYGIKQARGNYIALLDADDLWLPEHLEQCLKTIGESGSDAVYGSLVVRNMPSGPERTVRVSGPNRNETMINYLLRAGYGAQTSTLFMTSSSAKEVLWDETLLRHQDYDFVVRYCQKYRMTVKSDPTVVYRSYSKGIRIDFASCIRVIEAHAGDIEPEIYTGYHTRMLRLSMGQNADRDIIAHYRREATFYREYLSFFQFLRIHMPENTEQLALLRKEYIDHIAQIEVEL
jgi:glycosyltransferase involved in cell wall biosynthesis